jgi:hypothetical protein
MYALSIVGFFDPLGALTPLTPLAASTTRRVGGRLKEAGRRVRAISSTLDILLISGISILLTSFFIVLL